MNEIVKSLLSPKKLWSRFEVLTRPCPVPSEPGIYVWYFIEIPPKVPMDGSNIWRGITLLYLGISPVRRYSKGNLAKRIHYHYNGNAAGSTLRKSLGCLLSEKLGIRLHQVGSRGDRFHFAEGETLLSNWMAENAFVTWIVREEPWTVEDDLIKRLNLPLNLNGNTHHPFHRDLSKIRQQCKNQAIINP